MTTPSEISVFEALSAAFVRHANNDNGYYRFEVRPARIPSVYVRMSELEQQINQARLYRESVDGGSFGNELLEYVEDNLVQTDLPQRDYLVGPGHIFEVIVILKRIPYLRPGDMVRMTDDAPQPEFRGRTFTFRRYITAGSTEAEVEMETDIIYRIDHRYLELIAD